MIRDGMQRTMWAYAGIARDQKRLEEGLKEIERLKAQFRRAKVQRGGLEGEP